MTDAEFQKITDEVSRSMQEERFIKESLKKNLDEYNRDNATNYQVEKD